MPSGRDQSQAGRRCQRAADAEADRPRRPVRNGHPGKPPYALGWTAATSRLGRERTGTGRGPGPDCARR
jgi:hypothetical protein